MAVTVVRSNVSPTATNPQVTLQGVAANNTLFTFAVEADGNVPGLPTDSVGDPFTLIDHMVHGTGLVSMSLDMCLRAIGGRTVVTQPTTVGGRVLALELAGVSSPVPQTFPNGRPFFRPDVPDGIAKMQGVTSVLNPDIGLSFITEGPNGTLVFALCIASNAPTITLNSAGWSSVGTGAVFGLNYAVHMKTVPGPTQETLSWTLSTISNFQVVTLGFPAA